ncbi:MULTISPECIES: MucR family transcriptional regulator [Methylobacterium]|nr:MULTISPECIES: MucR family transcriptional regulator [Methylobacterium]PIU05083.1 MAG: MucR family transcriptional regulator [Methylobacterium sp. CG09_land_8_20_14_0_10_71_15]PIU11299.1 MAG: MucR family transcriptional regulator [Methylobacterium sp. CG08_land_8_20_14_0_20_71_15]
MSDSTGDQDRLITLAADLVSAYVSNNHVQSAELPKLIGDVHDAIRSLSHAAAAPVEAGPPKPSAQEVRRSVTADYLISFEDGKHYKTLRRHLTLRGLTPEQYRAKWSLPPDYPMTSQSYSAQRSELARSLGLGQQRRKSVAAKAAAPAEVTAEAAAPAKKPRAPRKAKGAE